MNLGGLGVLLFPGIVWLIVPRYWARGLAAGRRQHGLPRDASATSAATVGP